MNSEVDWEQKTSVDADFEWMPLHLNKKDKVRWLKTKIQIFSTFWCFIIRSKSRSL